MSHQELVTFFHGLRINQIGNNYGIRLRKCVIEWIEDNGNVYNLKMYRYRPDRIAKNIKWLKSVQELQFQLRINGVEW